jgi:hypothetical protein
MVGERVHCFAEPVDADYATVVVRTFADQLALPGCDARIVIG